MSLKPHQCVPLEGLDLKVTRASCLLLGTQGQPDREVEGVGGRDEEACERESMCVRRVPQQDGRYMRMCTVRLQSLFPISSPSSWPSAAAVES